MEVTRGYYSGRRKGEGVTLTLEEAKREFEKNKVEIPVIGGPMAGGSPAEFARGWQYAVSLSTDAGQYLLERRDGAEVLVWYAAADRDAVKAGYCGA